MKPKKGWKNKPQQNESQQNIQAKPEQAGTIKLKVSTAKEKSKITEFAQTPGYIISTIILSIIGALGGFPVSIQLYSKFFDKPSLNFYPRVLNYNLFEDRDRNQKGTMLRFSGFL